MAYRSLVEVLAGASTYLVTPPSSPRHHPISAIALIPEMATSMSAEEEELYRLTWEAIQDVDAGRVVDHSAVEAWVESLVESAQVSRSHRNVSPAPSAKRSGGEYNSPPEKHTREDR
jgi:hypothetical protein